MSGRSTLFIKDISLFYLRVSRSPITVLASCCSIYLFPAEILSISSTRSTKYSSLNSLMIFVFIPTGSFSLMSSQSLRGSPSSYNLALVSSIKQNCTLTASSTSGCFVQWCPGSTQVFFNLNMSDAVNLTVTTNFTFINSQSCIIKIGTNAFNE